MDQGQAPQPVTQETAVTILLAVYNGALHLPAQLASIADQTHRNWQVIASDDGSKDDSVALLDGFAGDHPLTRLEGPSDGFNRNFMHLLRNLPDAPGLVALCDQDDVWLPGKLAAAVAALDAVSAATPALYCSRRVIWDGGADTEQLSRLYDRPPSFANALIENIAAGNTIVLNGAAARLVRQESLQAEGVFAHDWWIYQLITGVGGQVIYDPEPRVLYRQHAGNQVGAGETLLGGLANKLAVMRGIYGQRVGLHLAALKASEDVLTPQSRTQLERVMTARAAPMVKRLGLMRRAGVYRQGRLSDLMFRAAVCLGRV